MNHPIKKFPNFIADRFQPCVLCSFSPEVERSTPDIMKQIYYSWNNLMFDLKESTRLIFPKFLVDINTATNEIINMRFTKPSSKPYYFLNEIPKTEHNSELSTMLILRQRLFESLFMPFYCYCDIPISIILFVTDKKENAFPSKSYFPKWIQSYISAVKPEIIKFPVESIYSTLKDFYEKTFFAKQKQSEMAVFKNSQAVIRDKWILTIGQEPSKKMIYVKFFADMKMQQKKYKEAIEEYERLFDTPLGQQSRLLSVLCRIAKGSKSTVNIELLETALQDATHVEQFAIQLTKFYLNKSLQNMKSILPYGRTYIILNPFLYEQYAYICSLRKRSYLLYYASRGFSTIESDEYEIRSLYNSWGIVHPHNFGLVGQTLMEVALSKYSGEYISNIASKILSCRDIYHPQLIQLKLSSIKNQDAPICCGFVDTRVIKLEPNGFPCAPPEGFVWYWPKAAQQLFGAFDHKRFFSFNIFNLIECAANELITIRIFFHNRCPAFNFKNLKLKVSSSDIEVETFPELPESRNVCLKFIARSKGTVDVTGIEFEWENIKFEKLFPGPPIHFTVYENAPSIEISSEGGTKKDIYIGEIQQITIKIKNCDMKLKYLAMMAIGNINYTVLYPQNEELLGQRFLKALDPNEEYEIRLAVCGTVPGVNRLTLIFPFWTFNPPCRYNYQNFEFNASPAPEIPLFMQDEKVFAQCPHEYLAFGFTSALFDAPKYITKLKNRNCHMSLVSVANNEIHYQLPDYCRPFIEENKKDILFWYKSDRSFIFTALKNEAPVLALIENMKDNLYRITLKNLSNIKIRDIKVSFIEKQEDISYIFSGPAIKNIGSLEIGQSYEYKFRLDLLFDEASPVIMISGETFAVTHQLVIKRKQNI